MVPEFRTNRIGRYADGRSPASAPTATRRSPAWPSRPTARWVGEPGCLRRPGADGVITEFALPRSDARPSASLSTARATSGNDLHGLPGKLPPSVREPADGRQPLTGLELPGRPNEFAVIFVSIVPQPPCSC
jgi:hypothetical protein